MIGKSREFLSEVKGEVRKVTWPTRNEAFGGTAVVVMMVFLAALFLGIVDTALSKLVEGLVTR